MKNVIKQLTFDKGLVMKKYVLSFSDCLSKQAYYNIIMFPLDIN